MRVLGLLQVPGKGVGYELAFCIVVCIVSTFLGHIGQDIGLSYTGCLIHNDCLIFHLSYTSNESLYHMMFWFNLHLI